MGPDTSFWLFVLWYMAIFFMSKGYSHFGRRVGDLLWDLTACKYLPLENGLGNLDHREFDNRFTSHLHMGPYCTLSEGLGVPFTIDDDRFSYHA